MNDENNGKNEPQDNGNRSWADVVKYQPRNAKDEIVEDSKKEIIRSK